MSKLLLQNATKYANEYMQMCIKEGDIVIDATAGNGNDTLNMAKLVGEKGKVYAFDIQEMAINSTKERLIKENLEKRVALICDGHQKVKEYVSEKPSFAIFNLGYLPKGDHSIVTKPDTTIEALNSILEIMGRGGVVVLVVYHGHEGSVEEKTALSEHVKNLNQKQFTVVNIKFENQINNPPMVYIVEKR